MEAVILNITLYNVSPEPSAELLMNISRSRRLIVLLSHAYLEQDWCTNNFRSDKLNESTKLLFFLKISFRAVCDVAWLRSTTWGQCCYQVLQHVEFVCVCVCVCLPFTDRASCTWWSCVGIQSSSSCWRASPNAWGLTSSSSSVSSSTAWMFSPGSITLWYDPPCQHKILRSKQGCYESFVNTVIFPICGFGFSLFYWHYCFIIYII